MREVRVMMREKIEAKCEQVAAKLNVDSAVLRKELSEVLNSV